MKNLYIADAESSSIRVLNLEKGSVKSVAGGDLEPDNLFAYGDCDGIGHQAKLQHPLDVACVNEKETLLLVDTYNCALKKIDLKTRKCEKLINESSLELNEPSGICVSENTIWVADSNNHSIKYIEKFDFKSTYHLKEFLIEFEDKLDHTDASLSHLSLNHNSGLKVLVNLNFDINQEAENTCKIVLLNKHKNTSETLTCLRKFPKENVFLLESFVLNVNDLLKVDFSFNCITCSKENGVDSCKMVKFRKSLTQSEILNIIQKNDGQFRSDSLMIFIQN